MKKDSSWILAFIEDLRDVARDRDLPELAGDLEAVLTRHRPLLKAASAPTGKVSPAPKSNVVPLHGKARA